MPRRRQPEQTIQRAVVDHLAWRARPGLWWTHVPLGGWRTKIEAAVHDLKTQQRMLNGVNHLPLPEPGDAVPFPG